MVGLLLGFNLVFLACGGQAGWLTAAVAPVLGPLLGLLSLCVILCFAVMLLVWLLTQAVNLVIGDT